MKTNLLAALSSVTVVGYTTTVSNRYLQPWIIKSEAVGRFTNKLLAGCLVSLWLTTSVFAGAGHDHGVEETPTLPTVQAMPRLVLESSQFELVGILEEHGLHLYLDDYASNAPVSGATLELEIAGQRITAQAEADGNYHADLPQPLSEGQHPVLVTILAEQGSDLLIGELNIPGKDETPDKAEMTIAADWHLLPWLLALLGFALALVGFATKRDRQHRGSEK